MAFRKIFPGLGLNTSRFVKQPMSANLVFRTEYHDGDADQYRTHPGPTDKEQRQLGGRSVEYRTLLSIPFSSSCVTRTITPTRAWAKERLSSSFPDPRYCPDYRNISHPEAICNAQEGVLSDFRVSYLGALIVTDKSRAAKKQLIRDFEGKDGSASVDCQGLSSLPLLSPQESWELRNCDTLRVRSPNFLASPDTKSVTLHGCPPAFESLEFLGQLRELTHLDMRMSSAETPDRPRSLLYRRTSAGPDVYQTACDLAKSRKLQKVTLANFERIPMFASRDQRMNIRELTIRGCEEPIEARHLRGFVHCEAPTAIDLSGNQINSLPEEFFDHPGPADLKILFDPSKLSPEVSKKIAEAIKPVDVEGPSRNPATFVACADDPQRQLGII
jgi:hypothetical protein